MDLSVITVTWNSEKRIEQQIRSVVLGCSGISCEQIIIDNDSNDNTIEIIKRNQNIKLIENKENKGFGAANNQGVKIARGDFILFLNPDMDVKPLRGHVPGESKVAPLKVLVEWMREHKDIGIASCKLIKENGELNLNSTPRRLPKILDQLAIILKLPHLFPNILDKYLFRDFDPQKEQEVDSVQGSFMLVRREVIEKLGQAFDERYFIWFEDVDLCREVKKMGYKVMYTPVVSCVDYGGDSFSKRNLIWKQKNFVKSMFKYFWKWEI